MAETVHVTFLFCKGQRVRYADNPTVYTIASRTYIERASMGPVILYRLEREGILRDTAYEPDIIAVAEDEA